MTGLIVHEWIEKRGGSENVLEAIADVFPDAPILTPWSNAPERLTGHRVLQTALAQTPIRANKAIAALVLPAAWRWAVPPSLEYDWILASSHLFAHHVAQRGRAPQVPKLAYVHSPARYIWNPELDARGSSVSARLASRVLRPLDRQRAAELTAIAANSSFVRDRIRTAWRRDSVVIHPPVAVEAVRASLSTCWKSDEDQALLEALPETFLLGVSRFISYKRLHLVVEAGEAVGMPVVLAGGGPDGPALRARASAAAVPVTILENPATDLLHRLYSRATALVFPAVEDFGIVPVEAMAAGTPVIGVAAGGLLETVSEGENGSLVSSFDRASMARALASFRGLDADQISHSADRFSTERFAAQIAGWVAEHT